MSTTDAKPTWWLALTTEMAVSTGPGAGDEERAEAEPEDEASAVAVGLALRHAGEGPFEDVPERGDDEAGRHHAEDHEPGVAQEVLGQAERAQQRGPDEGDDAEADTSPATTA